MSAEDAAWLDSETFPLFVNTSMNSLFHLSNLDVYCSLFYSVTCDVIIRGGSGDLLEAGRLPNLEEGSVNL